MIRVTLGIHSTFCLPFGFHFKWGAFHQTYKFWQHSFIIKILLLFFLICGCNRKREKEILPVLATIYYVGSSCYEDTLLDKKYNYNMRELVLWISLRNPNDKALYIPIHSVFDKQYRSEIEIYKDTAKLAI